MHGAGNFQLGDSGTGSACSIRDRRGSDRYRTVCRVARVHRADDAGLWRVRNISDDGMMLAADVPVAIGESLSIGLSESVVVSGHIVWADEGHCGIAFSRKINAAAMLRALAEEQRAERHRALRLPIEAEAVLAFPDGAKPIDLVDISRSGAGFRCDTLLEPGIEVDLVLPGGDLRRRALVRWSRDHRGGLWFAQPLDRTDLETLARFRL